MCCSTYLRLLRDDGNEGREEKQLYAKTSVRLLHTALNLNATGVDVESKIYPDQDNTSMKSQPRSGRVRQRLPDNSRPLPLDDAEVITPLVELKLSRRLVADISVLASCATRFL